MRVQYGEARAEQIQIQRNVLHGTATICSPIFGRVCKVIWPTKTAEGLAAEVGCSIRAAAYQISGEHPPSDRAMLLVINRIFARGPDRRAS
jgi:hypothetical protein